MLLFDHKRPLLIHFLSLLEENKKTSWGGAGPSSDLAGIVLYFNFLQIWFDRIGCIDFCEFGFGGNGEALISFRFYLIDLFWYIFCFLHFKHFAL